MLDKDGMYSVIDSVCDQPIFFLISQTEDFSDFGRQKRVEQQDYTFKNEKETTDKIKSLSIKESLEETENKLKKAFTFSDFMELTSDAGNAVGVQSNVVKNEETVVEQQSITTEEENSPLEDDVESVYMMASSKNIDGVFEEYTKRKKSCSMLPTSSHSSKTKNTFSTNGGLVGIIEPLPPEIEQQRKSSIHKVSIKSYITLMIV